ncbi:UNVERIFIED_CONTAM: hypothetical protein RMT77_008469 [Armadillidium vulgare]|nr:F-box only protein 22 [Armadillidium vulgare]
MDVAISEHKDEVYFHIGNLFSTSREIIQKILSLLGYYDLVSAVQVCESWSLIGLQILEKRRLRYITIHPNGLKNTELQSINDLPPPFKSLENFLENVNYKSFNCLGFTCGGWLGRGDITTKFSPKGSTLCDLLKDVFPKGCEMALLEASGVVGSVQISPENVCKDDSKKSEDKNSYKHISESFNNIQYSIELEESTVNHNGNDDSMEALSLILFPEQPGVKFNIFNLDEEDFYKTYRGNNSSGIQNRSEVSQQEFNSVCGLEPEEDLKALIVFTYHNRTLTKSFLDTAQSRQNDKVAIGGGVVHWVQRDDEYYKGTVGIAISGRNVQTASIVVPSSVRDIKNLKLRLAKLKEKGLPEGHSLCFMFSCCGRGSDWYKKSRIPDNKDLLNVETRAFRELFPYTPIFGFFGDGEIGNNFYSRDEEEECSGSIDGIETLQFQPRKKRKRKQNLFHQYSTIFVLVSYL